MKNHVHPDAFVRAACLASRGGEYFLADVWRIAGDRSHCADGDQHSIGGADASGGDDPRADSVVHSAACGTIGQLCTDGGSGGIPLVVAYNMGEWREIPQLLKLTKTDISIWLVTVALTVFADLTVAVEAGMILAALLFISRVPSTTTVSQVTEDYVENGRVHILR